jgi:soluble lytic murein transglycosylase
MFGSLDRGYRSYALADHWLKSEELGRPPSSDNLWAWRCAYPRPYSNIVASVERRYDLPDSLVYAVMRQESGFRPNVVSPAGAVGLMQLMPATARRAADELTQQPGAPWVPDPQRPTNILNNVELGGFYLSKLLALLGHQMPVAIAAYNAGPTQVSHWLEGTDSMPVDIWVAHIPYDETRDYVASVLGNWLAYRYLSDPGDLPALKLSLTRTPSQALADAY